MKLRSLFPLYFLIVVGFVLSYLAVKTHVDLAYGLDPMGICSISKGMSCSAVLASSYSSFLGIPLGHWGMAYYFFLFFLTAFSVRRNNCNFNLVFWLTFFSVIFSFILFLISKFIIRSLCPICLMLYLANILILFSIYFFKHRRAVKFTYTFQALINELKTAFREVRYIFRFVIFGAVAWVIPYGCEYFLQGIAQQHKVQNLKLPWTKNYSFEALDSNSYYILGNRTAPVKIVEYADFECSPCRRMSVLLHKLIEEYPGKITLVYKNFPWNASCNSNLTSTMHNFACDAVTFSLCAGHQGKYWEANKKLMGLNWQGFNTNKDFDSELDTAVSELGLDLEQYSACIKTKQYQPILSAHISDARRLGISGTPSIFINGKLVEQPDEFNLRAIIKDILNEN